MRKILKTEQDATGEWIQVESNMRIRYLTEDELDRLGGKVNQYLKLGWQICGPLQILHTKITLSNDKKYIQAVLWTDERTEAIEPT